MSRVTEAPATRVPQAGDDPPPLALPDGDGTLRRLADQRGRWVIVYFYPTDDTPGCTTEACDFRDRSDELREAGAVVWGISPQGQASHRRFATKYGIDFPLLVDEGHAAAEAWGTWQQKMNYGRPYMGVARTTFLVDPDGLIARTWERVKATGHADDVLATLREAKATRASST